MEISQRGIDLIKRFEAFFSHAYDDGEGVWTIGWGTIRWDLKTPVKAGDTITREEAERQLRKELQRVEDAITAAVKVPLSQHEFDALCSFGYNVGIGWITGVGHQQATFIKQLNAGRRAAVPAGMLKFTRGANSGKHYDGLMNRRKDEVRLWLSPDDEPVAVTVAAPAPAPAPAPTAPIAAPAAEPMPQAVTARTNTTTQAVKTAANESGTFWSAVLGIFITIAKAAADVWSWLFSAAKDAGADVAASQNALSTFDPVLTALGANMGLVSAVIVVAAFAVVIVRKVSEKKHEVFA